MGTGPPYGGTTRPPCTDVPNQHALAQAQLRSEWSAAADFPTDDRTVMMPQKPDAGSRHAESTTPFCLILGGNGVRDEVEPAEKRFPGTSDGLTVGRAHQLALLT